MTSKRLSPVRFGPVRSVPRCPLHVGSTPSSRPFRARLALPISVKSRRHAGTYACLVRAGSDLPISPLLFYWYGRKWIVAKLETLARLRISSRHLAVPQAAAFIWLVEPINDPTVYRS